MGQRVRKCKNDFFQCAKCSEGNPQLLLRRWGDGGGRGEGGRGTYRAEGKDASGGCSSASTALRAAVDLKAAAHTLRASDAPSSRRGGAAPATGGARPPTRRQGERQPAPWLHRWETGLPTSRTCPRLCVHDRPRPASRRLGIVVLGRVMRPSFQ